MRILFDTNVIIAAFISHGACHELFEYYITSNHKMFISEWILNEVHRTLTNKFKYSKERANEVISLLRKRFTVTGDHELKKSICKDKDDDNILAAGIFSKVDCIITGDNDLLGIEKLENIVIIKPQRFWMLEKETSR